MKCVKYSDGRMIIKETRILERWWEYLEEPVEMDQQNAQNIQGKYEVKNEVEGQWEEI